jgi:hypothetical protein
LMAIGTICRLSSIQRPLQSIVPDKLATQRTLRSSEQFRSLLYLSSSDAIRK